MPSTEVSSTTHAPSRIWSWASWAGGPYVGRDRLQQVGRVVGQWESDRVRQWLTAHPGKGLVCAPGAVGADQYFFADRASRSTTTVAAGGHRGSWRVPASFQACARPAARAVSTSARAVSTSERCSSSVRIGPRRSTFAQLRAPSAVQLPAQIATHEISTLDFRGDAFAAPGGLGRGPVRI
jgi:hypothetical protein